ncbi:MAG: hypothetical protein H7Y18_20325 [Clostridiaceae bacterium]|nr:hypothetical protein [Clostridiaceae bacterium]
MAVCLNCGKKVARTNGFCIRCGGKGCDENVIAQQTVTQQSTKQASSIQGQGVENNITLEKKQVKLPTINLKLSKIQKIGALVTGIVLVLVIISYNVGASVTSRDKVLVKFNQALNSKDSSKLARYIVSSDIKQKIDTKAIGELLNYIEKNPSYRDEIAKSVKNQSLNMGGTSNLKVNNTEDLFTLKKSGKTWFFYDRYVFELKAVYINIQTDFKDTQVFLGDKLICTANKKGYEKVVGPYLPGLYKIKAILKGAYVNMEKSIDVDLVKVENSTNKSQKLKSVKLNLDVHEVSIDSDYEDAKLFVNGKDTKILVKDAKKFGPVSKDGSVKIYAEKEFPWGLIKSEEVKVDENSSINLKLAGVNDNLKSTLMNTVNDYNKSWVEAIKSRDASKFVNVGGKIKETLTVTIENAITEKDLYKVSLIKTSFDLDNFKVHQEGNKYYITLVEYQSLDFVKYKESDTIPDSKLEKIARIYTLIYDETSKKWIINDGQSYDYADVKNTKEFTF